MVNAIRACIIPQQAPLTRPSPHLMGRGSNSGREPCNRKPQLGITELIQLTGRRLRVRIPDPERFQSSLFSIRSDWSRSSWFFSEISLLFSSMSLLCSCIRRRCSSMKVVWLAMSSELASKSSGW